MHKAIVSWRNELLNEPQSKALYAGFADLLAEVTAETVSPDDAGGNFQSVAGILGDALYRIIRSVACVEWRSERAVYVPAPRRERLREPGELKFVNTYAAFQWDRADSDRWGLHLQQQAGLGAWLTKTNASRGDAYRFVLELHPQWLAFANRCVGGFAWLIRTWQPKGWPIPCLGEESAKGWLQALRPDPLLIGPGVFVAELEVAVDKLALAKSLATTGFDLTAWEQQRLAAAYMRQGGQTPFFGPQHDAILPLYLEGAAKSKSEETQLLLRDLQKRHSH